MMIGVIITMVVLECSTCVGHGSSRVQIQGLTPNWLPTSAEVAAAVQDYLRLRCVYIVNNRAAHFDITEQRVALQFWKFLSLHGRQTAFPGEGQLGSIFRRHPLPLYVVLALNNSISHYIQKLAKSSLLSEGIWLTFLAMTTEEAFGDASVPFDSFVIVATQKVQREVLLEEVYRPAPHLPLETRCVGTWFTKKGELLWTRRPGHKRSLSDLTIKAATIHNPPFTTLEFHKNRTELTGGFFGKVWKILEQRLGFRTEWYTPHNETWNKATNNGTDLLHLIRQKLVDAVVSDVTITSSKKDIVTFTIPLLTYRFSVFIRQKENEAWGWKVYLEPFSLRLWLTVAASIPIFAALLSATHVFGHHERDNGFKTQFSFYNSIFYVYGAFCQQGTDTEPKTISCRMVYGIAFLSATVILAAYSGVLISFIATNQETIPISDIEELLHSGIYKLGVLWNSTELTFFSDAKPNTSLHRIYSEIMIKDSKSFPRTDEDGIQRVCEDNYAYMAPVEYIISVLERAKCPLVSLPRQYFEASLAIALSNVSEYKNLINRNLRSIVNTGVLQKLKDDTWKLSSSRIKPHFVSVSIKHIAPLLAVLFSGTTWACVLLVFELKALPVIKKLLLLYSERRSGKQKR